MGMASACLVENPLASFHSIDCASAMLFERSMIYFTIYGTRLCRDPEPALASSPWSAPSAAFRLVAQHERE
jgi:hypothetical protein